MASNLFNKPTIYRHGDNNYSSLINEYIEKENKIKIDLEKKSLPSRMWEKYGPLRNAFCNVDYSSVVSHTVQRASSEHLRKIFNKYSTIEKDGQKYMTHDDFVKKYLNLYMSNDYNKETVRLLTSAINASKSKLISFEEFCAFEAALCKHDILYLTAFQLFDNNSNECISFSDFERIIRHTAPLMKFEFDFDSDFIKRYFGEDKKGTLDYYAFCQLLHDFYEEQGKQAFNVYDKTKEGAISAEDFSKIMTTIKGYLLTEFVKNNLMAIASGNNSSHKVRYSFYAAFNSLLSKMELIKIIYLSLARGNLNLEVSKEEFLRAAQSFSHVTPYEVEILFKLAEVAHPESRSLCFSDIEKIDPERLKRVTYTSRLATDSPVNEKKERSTSTAVLESLYRFVIGSVAGACGATAVYPIDLVKTRMQNQRTSSIIGEVAYKNSLDCFKKVVKFEGVLGLYRGLLPQLVGVAPEKAIKLTINDFVRDKFTDNEKIPLYGEIIAGGCGGGCQVIFTNPLEIVKIRLQVAGELQSAGRHINVFTVLKDLGFFGLYKGARACFLRDIPFSAIYFPAYAHAKLATADKDGHNSLPSLFGSAFISGVPAAALVTPADVIKTRLQVATKAGQTTYNGIYDCAKKIMAEEGPTAFWKGTAARVFRSSPQFGFTLLTYELLQRVFHVDFH